ncbi:hypothetical protein WJX72_001615 [[Myrmecia] bisecta]|uniref:Peptidylprolyl isomerase n=1 Tax=[Myrmecia] bisecta TaxID=41462 RepID=A0AAW1Q6I9_9CHLO
MVQEPANLRPNSGPKPKVLIANRGEIARRVQRTCRALGLVSVAVYTEPDALSLHVREADEAVCLGASPRDYTNAARLVEVAVSSGCAAVHPGYGFLSENAEFVDMCEKAGVAFLGPTGATMRMFSRKHTAREFAESAKVPILSGSSLLTCEEEAVKEAEGVGYPVLLKATGGGGGIGIYICRDSEEVKRQYASASRQGQASFGDAGVFVEKYVEHARHIEVQIFGDGRGGLVTLGERECSIQRRHQKILEESPSPFVDANLRAELVAAATRLGQAAKYRSAGTVEFLVDQDTARFYFLEVNTRLQVEHGITEMCTRLDLVEHGITEMCTRLDLVDWQISLQVPGMTPPDLHAYVHDPQGWAIEVRINAEDPLRQFMPASGTLGQVVWPAPQDARVDSWVESGTDVTPFFDSLLGKLMVHAPTRDAAIAKLQKAIAHTQLKGIPSNLEYLGVVAASAAFKAGDTTTQFLTTLPYATHAIEVVSPGMNSTVQDFPGRMKLWHIGVPPSGPMDSLAFRLANALLTGTAGSRGYVAVAGGIDTPVYLGSRATFPGGKLGGVQGRPLRAGDMLPLGKTPAGTVAGTAVPAPVRPVYAGSEASWEVGVLPGPNAEPDYFTEDDIQTLYSSTYTVHYNSNRLGIRLQGPRPKFARPDGGEGGSHPSNVHDHVYAIGTINFTGDMPIVLMFDGPSLGGFVCPATITSTELWKMGQVRANDTIKFKRLTLGEAYRQCLYTDKLVERVCKAALGEAVDLERDLQTLHTPVPHMPETSAVLLRIESSATHPGAIYRLAGDRYVFVEYGPMELDLNLRVRVAELEQWVADQAVPGIVETSPGVRSCMIEYDQRVLPVAKLLNILSTAEASISEARNQVLSSRILHLPMAFNERWTNAAVQKYMKSSRAEAPYLPSNVDFVAANNGLEGGADDVRRIVFDASYMVLGLGDVYLGAPCAVPVDPRHRLVVPKYNPARTFTPEGTVGLGGSYMCIYPMDSPGGYQLIGRTLPIWNTFGRVKPFSPDAPWLLRIFDQVRFVQVSEEELEVQRKQFANGQLALKIEEQAFSMREYNQMLLDIAPEVAALKAVQQECAAVQMAADEESLQRLKALEAEQKANGVSKPSGDGEDELPKNGIEVTSTFTANVWEVLVGPGDVVSAGQTLIVLEAMKMEYPILAPKAGRIASVKVEASELTQQGDVLAVLVVDEKSSEE